jgi:hypothetical protein
MFIDMAARVWRAGMVTDGNRDQTSSCVSGSTGDPGGVGKFRMQEIRLASSSDDRLNPPQAAML